MSWSISMTGAPRIRSYEEARRFFDSVEPFKDSNERPLCGRRMPHKAICERPLGALAFKLYRTDMITYYPDGDIAVNCYSSNSSHDFIWHFLPQGMGTASGRNRMFYTTGGKNYTSSRTLNFSPKATNTWELANPEDAKTFTKDVLDRKKAYAARKFVKPFQDWAAMFLRLKGGWPEVKGEDLYAENRIRTAVREGQPLDPGSYLPLLASLRQRVRWAGKKTIWEDLKEIVYDAFDAKKTVRLPLGTLPSR